MINKNMATNLGKQLEDEISKIAKKHKFKILRNVYIGFKDKFNKQKYTEVDIILISKKGIFVIEAKNYTGTLKGSKEDKLLTIQYNSGKKFNIYNPILQNDTHMWAVSNFLNISEDNIKSLIIFSDSTNFRFRSKNIIKLKDLDNTLKSISKMNDIFTQSKVNSYFKELKSRTKVSKNIQTRHINQVSNNKKQR